jgi:hypothetical protein
MPATFIFAMTAGQALPFSGLLILAGIFLGPLAIYLRHSRHVQRISRVVEAELARFPRCGHFERDIHPKPRWLEVGLMMLVGPHLIISVIGQVGGPDMFRGTPLSGSNIGPLQLAAFLLIAVRLKWKHISAWLARHR